jgi:hypothetical protein
MVGDLSTLRSSSKTANEEEVPGLEISAQRGEEMPRPVYNSQLQRIEHKSVP